MWHVSSRSGVATLWTAIIHLLLTYMQCLDLYLPHMVELWKNGWTSRDAIWGTDSSGPSETCIRWGFWSPMERVNFVGGFLGLNPDECKGGCSYKGFRHGSIVTILPNFFGHVFMHCYSLGSCFLLTTCSVHFCIASWKATGQVDTAWACRWRRTDKIPKTSPRTHRHVLS